MISCFQSGSNDFYEPNPFPKFILLGLSALRKMMINIFPFSIIASNFVQMLLSPSV